MTTGAARRKLLGQVLAEGGVVTRSWLINKGFERHTVDNLVKSGQLNTLSSGVYTRVGDRATWQGVVYFLQNNLGLDLLIGGQTALEMHGLSHYIQLGPKTMIHLYGSNKLPVWVGRLQLGIQFKKHRNQMLSREGQCVPGEENGTSSFYFSYTWKDEKDLRISSPERAILEVLAGVPEEASVEYADQLLEGMNSLSPRRLQTLLEQCNNIKVKRLFFLLADRHQHPWLGKLRRETINLGAGKRMLVKGGKLDKKYNITIPKDL